MKRLRQPSKTSCGPTCVAMIAGVDVAEVLTALPIERTSARRARMSARNHRANVGDMRRLLALYKISMSRRRRPTLVEYFPARCLLRLEHPVGSGWHWAVKDGDQVLDPTVDRRVRFTLYHRQFKNRLSCYAFGT